MSEADKIGDQNEQFLPPGPVAPHRPMPRGPEQRAAVEIVEDAALATFASLQACVLGMQGVLQVRTSMAIAGRERP
jgi:hypothetical protein